MLVNNCVGGLFCGLVVCSCADGFCDFRVFCDFVLPGILWFERLVCFVLDVELCWVLGFLVGFGV